MTGGRAGSGGADSTASAVGLTVDARWERGEGWSGPTALVATARGLRTARGADPAPDLHLAGTVLPGLTDAHVHLALVDPAALRRGGLAAVDDLGGDPRVLARLTGTPGLPAVRYAGAFLTAPGGYPSDRSWAPPGAVEEVTGPERAVAAVDRQVAAGASFLKVVLHPGAGPELDDETLGAILTRARAHGRPVVAHVEGERQARRAHEAGIDRLAHAPFSERLPDDLVGAMARTQQWISTLDVHGWASPTREQDVAIDNLTRFAAAGGTVVYGTDQGNGPLPAGIDPRELLALGAAGLTADGLLRALTSTPTGAAFTYVPGEALGPDASPEDLVAWLARATVLVPDDLTHRPGSAGLALETPRRTHP
ncbi:amidohydrolase family protein [Oerskovia sp. Root22]|uniref:amidohydrolase family protein n=1 Tax=Oerskovia sp. Root22 TaxID=1736494 RepID=UPI0006F5FA44|nr:amidohydrolase family protein [Oerskovia sp. Root22]KRC35838.1 hypothetical protein ASE15_12310 [Oerskovia sp. Root22]